ncbi:hypothetical protein [Bacillus dakarensis]|nr:hypothetical protein [Bacillus dakarensis]
MSDRHLKELALNHQLVTPFNEDYCEGATINLTLGIKVKKYISR